MIFLKTKRKILVGSLWFLSHRIYPISWRSSWKRVLPEMHRYEKSLSPVIDQLKPDLIHVHDIFHLGLAARAIQRASQNGRNIKLVYDIHPSPQWVRDVQYLIYHLPGPVAVSLFSIFMLQYVFVLVSSRPKIQANFPLACLIVLGLLLCLQNMPNLPLGWIQ